MKRKGSCNVLRSAGLSLAILIAGCQTVPKETDDVQTQTKELDFGIFKSKQGIEDSLRWFKKGVVTEGEYEGLRLRTASKDKISSLDEYIDPNDRNVVAFNKYADEEIPGWKEMNNLYRAGTIYNMLKAHFEYRANPFDKLEYTHLVDFPDELKRNVDKVERFRRRKLMGIQTVSDTYKYRKGHCEDLAIMLTSHLRGVGIESYLVLVEYEGDSAAHIMVAFDSGLVSDEKPPIEVTEANKEDYPLLDRKEIFTFVDPAYCKDFDFADNMMFCQKHYCEEAQDKVIQLIRKNN